MNIGGFTCRACKNWRTTLAGFAAIMAGVGDLLGQFANWDWDATRLGTDLTGIATGIGLLFARDSAVSEQEHHEVNQEIKEIQKDATVAKEVANVAAVEAASIRTLAESK